MMRSVSFIRGKSEQWHTVKTNFPLSIHFLTLHSFQDTTYNIYVYISKITQKSIANFKQDFLYFSYFSYYSYYSYIYLNLYNLYIIGGNSPDSSAPPCMISLSFQPCPLLISFAVAVGRVVAELRLNTFQTNPIAGRWSLSLHRDYFDSYFMI